MKRFVLFSFNDYYPAGGMNDYNGSFDTLEEAQIKSSYSDCLYQEILDLEKSQLVWTKEQRLLKKPIQY